MERIRRAWCNIGQAKTDELNVDLGLGSDTKTHRTEQCRGCHADFFALEGANVHGQIVRREKRTFGYRNVVIACVKSR